MFARRDDPTVFRFEKLGPGDNPLYEGTDEPIRLTMSRYMPPGDADRMVCQEALSPKIKPFVFVAWREEHGRISLGFGHNPVFRGKSSERPPWFTSLAV